MPASSTLIGFTDRIWNKFDPEVFERFCFQVVALQNPGRLFEKTRYSGDGGVDVFSNTETDQFELFGFKIRERANLLIEAKRRKTVDLHDCARSVISAAADRECKYFALITTAPLNVATYVEISELCAVHRIAFLYIHREIIARMLIEQPTLAKRFGFPDEIDNWAEIIAQPAPPVTCNWAFAKISQVSGRSLRHAILATERRRDLLFHPTDRLLLSVILENISSVSKELRIEVVGLDRWRGLQLATRLDMLPSRSARYLPFQFELTARAPVLLPEVHVEAITQGSSKDAIRLTVSAERLHALPFFEPRFVGKVALQRKAELQQFAYEFLGPPRESERLLEWALIEGAAGVGKSRLVEEALIKPYERADGGESLVVARFFVQKGGSLRTIAEVLRGMIQYCRLGLPEMIRGALRDLEREGLTDAVLLACAAPFSKPPTVPVLIILEDLHHGSDDLFRWLRAVRELTKHTSPAGSLYRICVTGRNDDTFPNPRQDAFWSLLQRDFLERDVTGSRFIRVHPLDDSDSQTLVRSIFNGITAVACERIVALSERVPFNILQIIEYLCEESLIEISERRTYSIRNEKRFYIKLGRPSSMVQLFGLRLRRLTRQPDGQKLVQLLQVLSFLGLQCDTDTFDHFAEKLGISPSRWELFRAGYLVRDDDRVTRFAHENILHFLQKLATRSARTARIAQLITSEPDLFHILEPWRQCLIGYLAGRDDRTRLIVREVVGDGSVAHLCRGGGLAEKRQILEIAVKMWADSARDRDSVLYLLNLHFLLAYSSKFTRNYGETIRDGMQALVTLSEDCRFANLIEAQELDIACAKIEQIVGHAYQNAADLEQSHYHIQRAQRIVNSHEREDPGYLDLKYDVEDRLRKNFVLFGDPREAQRCFRNACHAAQAKKDDLLLGTALYGEAELYFLQEPNRAWNIWRGVAPHVFAHCDERTRITLELALKQMELINADDEAGTRLVLDALKELGDRSLGDGLIGPLPKINLLNAYAYYRLGELDRAISENLAAYEKAEAIGYGVFLWFSQNNLALARQALDDEDIEAISQAFSTALDKAEAQGFLRHIVKKPTFFQNALVDNARRFYERQEFGLQLAQLDDRLRRNGFSGDWPKTADVGSSKFRVTHGTYCLFV